MWRIAFAVVPNDDGRLVMAFHGAWPSLLHRVFKLLKGALFTDYSLALCQTEEMINGKCTSGIFVSISNPDTHRASIPEWCTLITSLLRRYCRCQVLYCSSYEQFLNY